jgi:hypothetical protein
MLTTWHPVSAKFAITSPTICGRSVGIVCSRTQATWLFCHIDVLLLINYRKATRKTGNVAATSEVEWKFILAVPSLNQSFALTAIAERTMV